MMSDDPKVSAEIYFNESLRSTAQHGAEVSAVAHHGEVARISENRSASRRRTTTKNAALRSRVLRIRMSEEEVAQVREAATAADMKVSGYFRMAALVSARRISQLVSTSAARRLTWEVHKAGVNLNQLAKWANSHKEAASAEIVAAHISAVHAALQNLLVVANRGTDQEVDELCS